MVCSAVGGPEDESGLTRARSMNMAPGFAASIARGCPTGAPGVPFQWHSESSLTPMLDTGDSMLPA